MAKNKGIFEKQVIKRKFSGKLYTLVDFKTSKADAEKSAAAYRRKGKLARVAKGRDPGYWYFYHKKGYGVYVR